MDTEALRVVNAALVELGEGPLVSLTGDAASIVARNSYEAKVREIFTKAPWKFATFNRPLQRMAGAADNHVGEAWAAPAGMLALWDVTDARTGGQLVYDRERDTIYVRHAAAPQAKITVREHETRWTPGFRSAVIFAMMGAFARGLAHDVAAGDAYDGKSDLAAMRAASRDAMSVPTRRLDLDTFLRRRRRRYGGLSRAAHVIGGR